MERESVVVIANAVIWGCVLIACAVALTGTGAFKEIQLILGGGAAGRCWGNSAQAEGLAGNLAIL